MAPECAPAVCANSEPARRGVNRASHDYGYLQRHRAASLVSSIFIPNTAAKTQKVINSANGGVLFIDEVYSLGNSEKRDSFAKECIDTINQNLTENKGKFLCIVAGYKEDIDSCFFSYNQGLERRFPIKYQLDGYDAIELYDIFKYKLNKQKKVLYLC